jgi:hypothetical protein
LRAGAYFLDEDADKNKRYLNADEAGQIQWSQTPHLIASGIDTVITDVPLKPGLTQNVPSVVDVKIG